MNEENWAVFFSELVSIREQLQEINEGGSGIAPALRDLVECEKKHIAAHDLLFKWMAVESS